MTERVKIFTVAHVPPDLQREWLQHLRNFDVEHPGCHFEVAVDSPDENLHEMMQRLSVEPKLTFTKIFTRTKWEKP